jgi:hypothetical protein
MTRHRRATAHTIFLADADEALDADGDEQSTILPKPVPVTRLVSMATAALRPEPSSPAGCGPGLSNGETNSVSALAPHDPKHRLVAGW